MRRVAQVRQVLAIVLVLAAAGLLLTYLWQRRASRQEAARRPELKARELGLQIQQSAQGVTIARSENGRPVFRISAQQVDKLRQGGREVLHQVQIALYDRDGHEADRISGDTFSYDETSFDLSAAGAVQIELTAPDAVRVEANGLQYNVRDGVGSIAHGVDFHYRGADGHAASARLDSHAGWVQLSGGVHVTWRRAAQADLTITGQQAEVRRLAGSAAGSAAEAALIQLQGAARMASGSQSLGADRLDFYLGADETLRRLLAQGHLDARDTNPARPLQARADTGSAVFANSDASRLLLASLRLEGEVDLQARSGPGGGNQDRLQAGLVNFVLDKNHQLRELVASRQARLSVAGAQPQDLSAPEIDFAFRPGSSVAKAGSQAAPRLTAVNTVGRGLLHLSPGANNGGRLQAEADRMQLALDVNQQPAAGEADGDVRLQQTVGAELRTSRTDRVTLQFAPAAAHASPRVESVRELGHVELQQGDRSVRADRAVYHPLTRALELDADASSAYTGGKVRGAEPANRFAGSQVTWVASENGGSEITATGGVSLSHSAEPGDASGSLLASGQPVVITSTQLHWTQAAGPRGGAGSAGALPPGLADFAGDVRLLQSPNLLRADRMHLDGAAGEMEADGHVQTSLVQSSAALGATAASRAVPILVTADRLRFQQSQHRATYSGSVELHQGDASLAAPQVELLLSTSPGTGKLERAVATGGVTVTQPGRTAKADHASFDLTQHVVRLEGGPPSILDAEHGKISGDPLTFWLASDEIQVGSKSGGRARGQTVIPATNPITGHN
ncbi:MAG TPA: LptA/OstA family protein [Terriglobales bacterium]|nr:LptA/OstA family protein [Terriglobales bacterium]